MNAIESPIQRYYDTLENVNSRKIIRQVATGHDYRALLRVTIHAVFDVTHFRYLLRISSKYEA